MPDVFIYAIKALVVFRRYAARKRFLEKIHINIKNNGKQAKEYSYKNKECA